MIRYQWKEVGISGNTYYGEDTAYVRVCPICGHHNDEHEEICINCGFFEFEDN
jgi:hypothetical protein